MDIRRCAVVMGGIYRNIPFVLLGALIIVLFYKKAQETIPKTCAYVWVVLTEYYDMKKNLQQMVE